MPIENQPSNTKNTACLFCAATAPILALWNSAQPAQQGQGEPIMLTAVATLEEDGDGGLEPNWLLEGGTAELLAGMTLLVADNAPHLCDDDGSAQIYTHADPAEVEMLRQRMLACEGIAESHADACAAALAKLAEAQALLRRAVNGGDDGLGLDIDVFLSASAEPSAPLRFFGMNLVVSGNMPEDEMHLVGGEGGTVKLVLPSALVEKGFSEIRQQHYEEFMQRREARADVRASAERSAPKCDGDHGGGQCQDPECWNGGEPSAPTALLLGIRGKAFDQPGTHRAYTYTEQPGNDEAYRLGQAVANAKPGGDAIDHGLSLLKQLQAAGFGVFDIKALEHKA